MNQRAISINSTYFSKSFISRVMLSILILLTIIIILPSISYSSEQWVAGYNNPEGYGTTTNNKASAVAVDNEGNIYVTGVSHVHDSGYEFATIKYDSIGNKIWVVVSEDLPVLDQYALSIAVDESGNVYIAGTVSGYITIKYDSDGNELWTAGYNGPGNGYDYAAAMAVDASGNVYVTGASEGSGTDYDYATIKYDTNGNELWVINYH